MALSIREFGNDKCQLRASALTFYSLTSLVPVVAMFFGIAKGFGFETVFENLLREKLAGQEQIAGKIVEFSHSLLANTRRADCGRRADRPLLVRHQHARPDRGFHERYLGNQRPEDVWKKIWRLPLHRSDLPGSDPPLQQLDRIRHNPR